LRRVLIVEDNLDAAETLAELLSLWGHEVRVVHDGSMALETAPTFQPDVVLLDIGLPGMDGYEVARQLRKAEGGRRKDESDPLHPSSFIPQPAEDPHPLVLVALTGYSHAEDIQRSEEAGFDHHLTKPIEPEKLRLLMSRGRTSGVMEGWSGEEAGGL
jgi:CheY-like chemotaxis protein